MYLVSLTVPPFCPLTYDVFSFWVALTYTPGEGGGERGDVAPFSVSSIPFFFPSSEEVILFPSPSSVVRGERETGRRSKGNMVNSPKEREAFTRGRS